MTSIFSKIVRQEIPAYTVAENDDFLAFLDVFPLAKGHTLVIPKKETDYLFDLESQEYSTLWNFAKVVAKAQKKVIPCERIGVAVVGLEVPHAHIHLVPINTVDDLNFSREKLTFSKEEFQQIAKTISEEILF